MSKTNLRVKLVDNFDINNHETQYMSYEGRFYRLTKYSYCQLITIVDVTDAMKRGKTCNSITVESGYGENPLAWWNDLLSTNINNVFAAVTKGEITDEIKRDSLKITFSSRESKYFLPLDISSVKRLTKEPKKWTIPHAIKAIINNQVKNLRCKYYYTDDTCEDRGKGPIDTLEKRIKFAKDIIESPSGWWVMDSGNLISICCHHFNSNEFEFYLEGVNL